MDMVYGLGNSLFDLEIFFIFKHTAGILFFEWNFRYNQVKY